MTRAVGPVKVPVTSTDKAVPHAVGTVSHAQPL